MREQNLRFRACFVVLFVDAEIKVPFLKNWFALLQILPVYFCLPVASQSSSSTKVTEVISNAGANFTDHLVGHP